MTGNRSRKLRAIFLSFLMVVSIVGSSVALSGAAAAATADPTFDTTNIDGESFTQGETFNRTVTLEPGTGYNPQLNYTIKVNLTDEPDGSNVNLSKPSGFTIENISSGTVFNANGVDSDNLLIGSNPTAKGLLMNSTTSQDGYANISADNNVTTGDYTLGLTVYNRSGSSTVGSTSTTTFTVTANDVVNTDQDASYASIQTALNNADDGDTIEVSDGTYNESVTASTPNVTLAAASGATPTINASGTAVTVGASGVTVDGFELSGTTGVDANNESTIINNDLEDTTTGVNASDASNTVTATSNWWGDDTGPSNVGPGIGSSVTADVDFAPWLDAADGNEIPEVSVSPDTVVQGDTITLNGTIDGHPSPYTADIELLNTSDSVVKSTTTNDGDFSFEQELSEVGNYTVSVYYDANNLSSVSDTVSTSYNVSVNIFTEPLSLGDEVIINGTVTGGDGGGIDGETLTLEYENGSTAASGTTAGLGFYEIDTTLDDAGEYALVDSNGLTLDTINVSAEQADLSLSSNATQAFAPTQFELQLNDSSDNGLEVNKTGTDIKGYINVTGPFNESPSSLTSKSRVVAAVSDGAGGTEYVHVNTTADGSAVFNATPKSDADAVTASLEVDDGSDDAPFVGAENTSGATTYDTLDYVADDASVEITPLEALNVDVTPQDSSGTELTDGLTVDESDSKIEVSATDNDQKEVNASGSNWTNATVTISSDVLAGDSEQTITVPADEDTTPVTFDNLTFEQAGEVTVNVTVENTTSGTSASASDTLTVAGDTLLSLTPQEVQSGSTEDVSVQIGNESGNITTDVLNRDVFLNHSETDGFNVSGSTTDSLSIGSGIGFDLGQQAFVAEDVTFEKPGDVTLSVEDGSSETVNVTELTVTGAEKYELRTDEVLLAGTNGTFNLSVYDTIDNQTVTDNGTLSAIATNFTFPDNSFGMPVTSTDDVNNTITVSNISVAAAGDINISSETDGGTFTASGSVVSEAPVVETNRSLLTEGIESDVSVTATDPRDGSALSNGSVQFTANGTTFEVNGTNNETTEELDEDGTAVVNITPDTVSDVDNTSLTIAAQGEDGPSDYFGSAQISAGELQIAEREGGSDVELRDSINSENNETVTFVLRDANDARISGQDVDVTGLSNSVDKTTSEGFFAVDFSENSPVAGGSVGFNVTSDFSGTSNITAASITVPSNYQEVSLTVEVSNATVQEDGSLDFSVIRGDYETTTQATLTFSNTSDSSALTKQTGEVDTDNYGVVDISGLAPGDYTVTASKVDDDDAEKTFLNDSVEVTIEAPGQVQIPSDSVELDPSSVDANTTNDHDLTFDALNVSDDGDTDTFTVTIPDDADLENVNNVTVTDADGETVAIEGDDTSGNVITVDVAPDSDAIDRDLTVEANVTVSAPDVAETTDADITIDASDSDGTSDSASATLTIAPVDVDTGSLTFNDQTLGDDGAVTVEDVSTGQPSTVVVTYANNNENIVAGTATADNLNGENVSVTIEDDGGFPGEHTAWVFNTSDVQGVAIGDDATPVADAALASDTANITAEDDAGDDLPAVPDDFPSNEDAFRAIDDDNGGSLGSIELAKAISNNGNFEDFPELEIGSIEFAQIISWNAGLDDDSEA